MNSTLTPELIALMPPVGVRGTPAEMAFAHQTIAALVDSGELPEPDSCASCGALPTRDTIGRPTVTWHHPWYGLPLAVVGLCPSSHRRTHGGSLVEAVTGRWWPTSSGLTRPEIDALAREWVPTLTAPVARPQCSGAGWRLQVHDAAVELGLLRVLDDRYRRRYVPTAWDA